MTKSDDKKSDDKNVITKKTQLTKYIYKDLFSGKTLIPLFIKNDKTIRLKLFD